MIARSWLHFSTKPPTDLDAIAAVLEADNEEDETRWRATAADPEETPQQ